MRILMVTNVFLPHVSGVTHSVLSFSGEFRRRGHEVKIVAPDQSGVEGEEKDVIRLRAIKDAHPSGLSLPFPASRTLRNVFDSFRPDIVHVHQPFLLGRAARRIAWNRNIPVVFTHHSFYENFTRYVLGDGVLLKNIVASLATDFADRCSAVFAPTPSVGTLLAARLRHARVHIVPTGISLGAFAQGDREGFRARSSLPHNAFVVGHAGRFAPEKNLRHLSRSLARFLVLSPSSFVVLVGDGPERAPMARIFEEAGVVHQVRFTGFLTGRHLVDAYKAMDVFAFASATETQGLVLYEAMAAGLPVIANANPVVEEVVCDQVNGRLISAQGDSAEFTQALCAAAALPSHQLDAWRSSARQTAERYSAERSASLALSAYAESLGEWKRVA